MIEDHYLNRITSQHKIRPRFMAWLSAYLDKAEDAAMLLRSFNSEFDIESARGTQLDTIGKVVGVERLLNFEPVYAEPLLSDEYYRMVLKAKISLNQWDGTIQGIKELWDNIFGGYTLEVVDHQDMSMTLRVINLNAMFESEFISRGYLAPKPEAVRVNYEFVLTRSLDATLYLANTLGPLRDFIDLSTPNAVFKLESGEFFVGGRPTGNRSLFALPPRVLSEGLEWAGEIKIGGRATGARSLFSLASKPLAEKLSLIGGIQVGGTHSAHSSFTFPGRDPPTLTSLTSKLYDGGGLFICSKIQITKTEERSI